jgi:transposase InsO family protein
VLLQAAGLARSTFYYQQAALQVVDKYAAIKDQIKSIYERHKGRYGYRRITETLRGQGRVINHKTVQRLMEKLQLKSLVRVKKYRSYRGQVGQVAPNLIDRDFKTARPNEKWVTDVTEFKVEGQKLYLSPVMDLFNGEIIAYTTARRPLFNMIGTMLNRAFFRLGPADRPVLHSDQGWQYQMEKYRRRLNEHAITQSMSRKGNCLDNAAMESFFATLKSEYFYLNKFSSLEELETGLRGYIHYYNQDRIRLKLNGLSPIEYRKHFATH